MRRNLPEVVEFKEVDKHDVGLVGGKGANLGEMIQAKFPIPYGFIVTSQTYFEVIKENKLADDLKKYLDGLDYNNQDALHHASVNIKKLIDNVQIPKPILSQIIDYYQQLNQKEKQYFEHSKLQQVASHLKSAFSAPIVAVRSSATAED